MSEHLPPPPPPPPSIPPGPPPRAPSVPPDEPSGSGGPRTPWRRFARVWGFALFLLVIVVLFRHVLMPFIFAVLLAYVLAPAVNRLSRIHIGRRHMPRGLSVVICYVVLLTTMIVFFAGFLPRLSNDFARLGSEAPKLWDKVQNVWTPQVARWLEKNFPSLAPAPAPAPTPEPPGAMAELPPPPNTVVVVTPMANGELAVSLPPNGLEIVKVDDKHMVVKPRQESTNRRLEDILRERIMKAVSSLEGEIAEVVKFGQALITGIISAVMGLVLVLMIAAFILIDIKRIHGFIRTLVPAAYRDDYENIMAGIDRGLSGVIRGQLFVCVWNGILTYIGLMIFDVKYALLFSAVAAILSVIPIFGSILSSIPIVAVALVSGEGLDMVRALAVLAWIIGIHFIEANFVSPRLMATTAKLHPVVVVFALIAGEYSGGLVGAFLAVPAVSIIQTIFLYFRSRSWKVDTSSLPR